MLFYPYCFIVPYVASVLKNEVDIKLTMDFSLV